MIIDQKYTALPDGVELNPLQELIVPYMHEVSTNLVVKSPTGSGKSTAITMLGTDVLEQSDSDIVVYVGITKALVDEKREDFDEDTHPWKGYDKVTVTGDFKFDAKMQKELDTARIVVITPESLVSRLRNQNSDKSTWLNRVKMVVWDEVHLIADASRGGNYETAVMEMARVYPSVRHLALSGTILNAPDFKEWFERINPTKKTELIESDYRPVPIKYTFMTYPTGSVAATESSRIQSIVEMITAKSDEQWMICVWKKAFGKKILDALTSAGYRFMFHHGSLTRDARKDIEHAYKQKALQGVICTQTLMTGVNTPSRNVIITSAEFGRNPIPVYELMQAAGRAGRPRYDDMGFVYFLLNERNAAWHKARIERGEPICSTFVDIPTIATHFLGAVYMNAVTSKEDFGEWFKHTFYKKAFDKSGASLDQYLEDIIKDMERCRMVYVDHSVGYIGLTRRGTICAQMMLDPYHFADLIKNFDTYNQIINPTDVDLARAFASCNTYYSEWMSDMEKRLIPDDIKKGVAGCYHKHAAVVYWRVKGETVPQDFYSVNYQVWTDSERYSEGLLRAAMESEKWVDVSYEGLKATTYRIIKGCSYNEAMMAVNAFKKSEATKLAKLGLHTLADVRANPSMAAQVLKPTRLEELGIV